MSEDIMNSFHFSVDDVLPALIEVTDRNIPLTENKFFNELRFIYEQYGVKTGLNIFYSHVIDGRRRFLSEVRDLKEEIKDGWIYFAPHAVDFDTPPYSQNIKNQIMMLDNIMGEIDRMAGTFKTKSVRFHHYSECYEISENILNYGFNEMFVTDKLVGSHRLPKSEAEKILDKGFIYRNDLKVTRTHFRVENLANDAVGEDEIIEMFKNNLDKYSRIVIYSHEYEYEREDVNIMLRDTMNILVNKFGLKNERP